MRIAIFGASGMVGRRVVLEALWKGHQVTAFGRNLYELNIEHEKLSLVEGFVFTLADVKAALKNADAVLSALGGKMDPEDRTRSLGMKRIVEGMKAMKISRIVAIGGAGILQTSPETLVSDGKFFPSSLRDVTTEHWKAFTYLKESGLNFTMVCPPTIVEGDYTGTFHTKSEFVLNTDTHQINHSDLAAFMVQELSNNEFLGQRVSISNGKISDEEE